MTPMLWTNPNETQILRHAVTYPKVKTKAQYMAARMMARSNPKMASEYDIVTLLYAACFTRFLPKRH